MKEKSDGSTTSESPTTTRRQLGKAIGAGVVIATLPHIVKAGERPIAKPIDEIIDELQPEATGQERFLVPPPTSIADRRFRRAFVRALIIQRRRGNITKKQFARAKAAAYSGLPIAASGKGKPDGIFIQHLRKQCEAEMKKSKLAEGPVMSFFDDLFDNLDWSGLFGMVVNWLIENWDKVLGLMLTLLLFLEAAEKAETE